MWPFTSGLIFPELTSNDVGLDNLHSTDQESGKGVYDYIICGGGTAGCVLANRLSEDPSVEVLLIERGRPSNTYLSRVPLISADFRSKFSPSVKWFATPATHMDDTIHDVIASKALGGSSRINCMLYTRGAPSEFNRWSESGCKGWSYEEVEPFFMKSEGTLQIPVPEHHGSEGPWPNRRFSTNFGSTTRCAAAAEALGLPFAEDLNSPNAPAVCYGRGSLTIGQDGYRSSTSDAFLPVSLAIDRSKNLHICTQTMVTSLDIQEMSEGGLKATGVFFRSDVPGEGTVYRAHARKEVVICAGALGSPQVLMLSGLGPAAYLTEKGIRVKKDLPGVGSNLQDHIGIPMVYRVPLSDSLNVLEQSPIRAIQELMKYMVYGTGLFLMPINELNLFIRSSLLADDCSSIRTDNPAQLDAKNSRNICDIEVMTIAFNTSKTQEKLKGGLFSLLGAALQPHSSGTVRLTSTDPSAPPAVDLGFLSDPRDYEVLRKVVKTCAKIAETMKTQQDPDGSRYAMTDYIVPESYNDKDIDAFIRKNARTSYHYAATCRMAAEDDARPGVVDNELRVHGVEGLRIADASIFPDVIATHLQAPVVMVAEKCADMLKRAHAQ